MGYEFSEEYDKILISVSTLAFVIAGLFIVGGLAGAIDALIDVRSEDGIGLYATILLIMGILQIVVGILIIPAVQSLKSVATTEGSDIDSLLEAITKMGSGFYVLTILLMIVCILGILNIFNPEGLV